MRRSSRLYVPEIHRRRSIRLPDYDYTQAGTYFVTICAQGRRCLFGEVVDGEMLLNPFGRIAHQCWMSLPDHFVRLSLDEAVVMPNHVHGIFCIVEDGRGTACRAPTMERFAQPVSGSIPTIIRSFKSAVTRAINQLRNTPGTPIWQSNYYERVIRDDKELAAIRQYIVGNPAKWLEDGEYPQNWES